MKKLYTLLLLLALFSPLFSQQNLTVHFQSGDEIFPENFSDTAENFAVHPAEMVSSYYVRYVQCTEIPSAAERAAVEAEGVRFLGYVSFGAYLVALPQDFDLKKLEKIRVRSIVSVKNEWKMAKNLREQPFGEWALHGDLLDVNLQVYPHVSIAQSAEMCRRLGMTILLEGNQNGFLQVRFSKNKLDEVAALPWVQSLELVPPPSEPDDTRGRALHRSNGLDSDHAFGKKFNGDGVSILVRDDGPVGEHIDFQGRVQDLTGFGDNGNHGDGVSGIFTGAGNLDPTKKGMAAGATLYVVRYTPEFQDQTLPLHLQKNVTITNSSYSNGCNAGYTLAAQTVDKQIFENPTLMHVFSSGNSNNISTCLSYGAGSQWGNITGGHKMAKNAIATANLNADASLVGSSSRGPAYDGRLKPDISANGNQQYSTDHNNTYMEFSGTSAAAPGIAGCLAQLTHAFKSLNNGQQPPSALLKAAILNTANDLGNAGPDFKYGWGHVNTTRALQLLEENRWLQDIAYQSLPLEYSIQIPSGIKQARFMLYWAELPASVAAAKALVNDLDLTVTSVADGSISLPWKLDPTPDPAILDLPAGHGRDSLNNVEQVTLDNPAPGFYTVRVLGTEIPLGAQPYFLVWEFLTDEAKITYPIGGEGFVPGEFERIHWDAYGNDGTFSLRYSTDNGFSWNQIADVPGNKRMYDWQIPNIVSGRVRLQIQRGVQTHTTEFPLSIAPLPTDIQVAQVCPNSMTINWKPAADTLASNVYLLGKKYMEVVGTTPGNTFTIPLQNGGTEQWVSVRASGPNGLAGRRAVAVRWPGELKNCVQPDDLGVRFLLSPNVEADIRCNPFSIPISVEVKNEGANAISGAMLNYQANNQPVVSQTLPNIPPNQTLSFTFQTPLSVTENEQINLKIWSTYAAEDAFFNDTLRSTFDVLAKPVNGYFNEDFEGDNRLPFGWNITNPDGGITWTKTMQPVTGSNGQSTNALRISCYSYFVNGEEDHVDLIPVDLSGLSDPAIAFDVAHARRLNSNNVEKLRVEVFPACNLTAPPVVVWEKNDPELATTSPHSIPFSPNEAGDWRKEVAQLSQFAGQKIIVRFTSVNGSGNNIFLDNIGIVQYDLSPPTAAFNASADSVCNGETLVFQAIPTGGSFTNYTWNFGTSSQPTTASGLGPHTVKFSGVGDNTVRMIVLNALGTDTINKTIKILDAPTANFSAQISGLVVTFNNSSQKALTYFWDFGDNASSTLANPVHTYAAPGLYSVRLEATNQCKTVEKLLKVPITTSVNDLSNQFAIRILPNPTAGDFRVEIESKITEDEVRLSLFDAQGRLIKEMESAVNQGFNSISFENLRLPKGIYQLNVRTERGRQGFTVIVQ